MAIARVDQGGGVYYVTAHNGGAFTTVNKAFNVNVTAGSLLVAVVYQGHVSDYNPTFSDNNGNTWATGDLVTASNAGLGNRVFMGYCENANAGATTVTVTIGTGANMWLAIAEITGIATSSAVDGTPTSAQASSASTPTAGNVTTTGDAYWVCPLISYPEGAGITVGSGFTLQLDDDTPAALYKCSLMDAIVTGADTRNGAWGESQDYWCTTLAAFKTAGGGGGGSKVPLLMGYYEG